MVLVYCWNSLFIKLSIFQRWFHVTKQNVISLQQTVLYFDAFIVGLFGLLVFTRYLDLCEAERMLVERVLYQNLGSVSSRTWSASTGRIMGI
ncbi:hypothetical protein IHE45_09G028800 [Dioscorea alata]|uniref:Uncharacterized protein n=1 Tax=Dioscorea alata TaxID=55571 RepID=A0ACB7VED5_DIOAL|nr:hypothetical protein IHE45_09G028800 [Dioscorea alata]